jgi:hypothetical protein
MLREVITWKPTLLNVSILIKMYNITYSWWAIYIIDKEKVTKLILKVLEVKVVVGHYIIQGPLWAP